MMSQSRHYIPALMARIMGIGMVCASFKNLLMFGKLWKLVGLS